MTRPPVPPFDHETARQKVQAAEDAWNTRDPERVAGAYTPDTVWRNRSEFLAGRAQVIDFLTRKWQREQDYALRKSLWAFTADRIAVRFQYEWHDDSGQWWRSYGNENWEFDPDGSCGAVRPASMMLPSRLSSGASLDADPLRSTASTYRCNSGDGAMTA